MSGPDALHGEMPGFPFPGRPGGEHDEPLLDMILDRRPLPPGAPPEAHDLARLLAALAGPAEPGELAGEAVARAAFTRTSPASISPAARRPSRSRRSAQYGSRRSARHGSRRPARRRSRPGRVRVGLATALVVAAAGLGAVAAYVGVLPGPIHLIAQVAGGAPARQHDVPPSTAARGARPARQPGPRPAGPPTSSPAGPASTAPAAGQSGVPAARGESSRSGHRPAVGKCPQFSLPSQASTPGPVYIPPQPKKAGCPGPVAPAGPFVIPKP
jgi:hypothetical protein